MRRTQRAIKQVLTERFYSWRDAEEVAKNDIEISLDGDGPIYVPQAFEEESLNVAASGEELVAAKHAQNKVQKEPAVDDLHQANTVSEKAFKHV